MHYTLYLMYNREIPLEPHTSQRENPFVEARLEIIEKIAGKHGLSSAIPCSSYQGRFWKRRHVLDYFTFSTEKLHQACSFLEEILSAKFADENLVDKIEIRKWNP